MPEVDYMKSLNDVLVLEGEKVWFEKAKKAEKAKNTQKAENIIGLVGPEGGWSPGEREKIRNVE